MVAISSFSFGSAPTTSPEVRNCGIVPNRIASIVYSGVGAAGGADCIDGNRDKNSASSVDIRSPYQKPDVRHTVPERSEWARIKAPHSLRSGTVHSSKSSTCTSEQTG